MKARHTFSKTVFFVAGIYGVAVLLPPLLSDNQKPINVSRSALGVSVAFRIGTKVPLSLRDTTGTLTADLGSGYPNKNAGTNSNDEN